MDEFDKKHAPEGLTLRLKALDGEGIELDEIRCWRTELENLVFLTLPKEVSEEAMKALKESVAEAARREKKVFVFLPEGTQVLHVTEKWGRL